MTRLARPLAALVFAAFLAGCGADGPPVPPKDEVPAAGTQVTVGGTVKMGISGGSG